MGIMSSSGKTGAFGQSHFSTTRLQHVGHVCNLQILLWLFVLHLAGKGCQIFTSALLLLLSSSVLCRTTTATAINRSGPSQWQKLLLQTSQDQQVCCITHRSCQNTWQEHTEGVSQTSPFPATKLLKTTGKSTKKQFSR